MTVDLPVEMAVLRIAQINADYANFWVAFWLLLWYFTYLNE